VSNLIDALTPLNWDAIGSVANVIMAAASVFGLYFIYRQLERLAKQEGLQNAELKLSHYSEYTKRYQDILLNLPSDVGTAEFRISRLNSAAKEKVLVQMRAYFDLCYEEWDLYKREMIDESSWAVWNDGMHNTLRRPAFREAWKYYTKDDSEFGTPFTEFVNKAQSAPN
jgi:hypothetical protein